MNLADLSEFQTLPLRFSTDGLPGGVAFSPDSASLAHCEGDGTIAIRELSDPSKPREFKRHTESVTSLAFSPDGTVLISGSRDHSVRVWDVPSGRELWKVGTFAGFVSCLAVSPDGRHLAVGGFGQTVKIFETGSWQEINSFKGHQREIRDTLFLASGQELLTCSTDGSIKCWPVGKRQEPVSYPLPSDTRWATLAPEGKSLYLTHKNQTYSIWRTDPCVQVLRRTYPRMDGWLGYRKAGHENHSKYGDLLHGTRNSGANSR